LLYFSFADLHLLRYADKSLFPGDTDIGDHAFSVKDHFPVTFYCQINDLLDAADIGCETGDNNPASTGLEKV